MRYILSSLIVLVVGLSLSCEKKTEPTGDTVEPKTNVEPELELKEIPWKDDLGIGPIKAPMTLGDIDDALAETGKTTFKEKCSACHKMSKKYIGPALKGVTTRRTPAWVMNMILNPEEMVVKNAAAKKLLMEFNSPMADQSLTNEEARSILEYFRRSDSE